ncbi:unnamed protein product [Closterium sp. NIES-53]
MTRGRASLLNLLPPSPFPPLTLTPSLFSPLSSPPPSPYPSLRNPHSPPQHPFLFQQAPQQVQEPRCQQHRGRRSGSSGSGGGGRGGGSRVGGKGRRTVAFMFEVDDTGLGIPPPYSPSLFSPLCLLSSLPFLPPHPFSPSSRRHSRSKSRDVDNTAADAGGGGVGAGVGGVGGEQQVGGKGRRTVAFMFEVDDTGPGIPVHKRESIFENFQQADVSTARTHGGTGELEGWVEWCGVGWGWPPLVCDWWGPGQASRCTRGSSSLKTSSRLMCSTLAPDAK